MNIKDHFSPNCHARSTPINAVIIHHTNMLSAKEAIARLRDPEAKVSSHYLIDKSGEIYRLVSEDDVAYHAGISCWRGQIGLNESSIGIELDNLGHSHGPEAFPAVQIEALIMLIDDIRARHKIDDRWIVGHSDIAPSRKKDPGELFPWKYLAKKGHGIWKDANQTDCQDKSYKMHSPEEVRILQAHLRKIGYDVEETGYLDPKTVDVVLAFQRHFLPLNITGDLDFLTEHHILTISKKFS